MPGYGACGAMPLRAGLAEKRSLQRSGAPVLSAKFRVLVRGSVLATPTSLKVRFCISFLYRVACLM